MTQPQINVVLIGDPRIGKSSLIHRFVNRQFQDSGDPNIPQDHSVPNGITACTKELDFKPRRILLRLWDINAHTVYGNKTRLNNNTAFAAIICYDLANNDTLFRIPLLITELRATAPACLIYLCGLRNDRPSIDITSYHVTPLTRCDSAVESPLPPNTSTGPLPPGPRLAEPPLSRRRRTISSSKFLPQSLAQANLPPLPLPLLSLAVSNPELDHYYSRLVRHHRKGYLDALREFCMGCEIAGAYETSAKTGVNVDVMFHEIINEWAATHNIPGGVQQGHTRHNTNCALM
ncbi:P-loop containing nucleoside triphosphate hydrolase protein [Dimargaris cristalligena]|uniref:P-loop containing nucleoside triphosphate hydrolase protein n=1 Tax=Dimargaris cristalligena TaxID=215637 RepID=A0A4P9ZW66_9FUNG|nr:P-loop containing nucleoside triphosphate hydrolase protein [Dimargaris cristalligena]|eukprot:RKP37857.1 P-loop containing nucleoside triphosphate hydrolase protein [Dimargaris cristalligena]